MHSSKYNLGRILVFAGATGLIIGMMLPWFQTIQPLYGRTIKPGYLMNGLRSGFVGGIILLVAIFKISKVGKPYSLFCTLLGLYILSFLIGEYASISTSVFIFRELGASLSIGLYVSIIGALLITIGGIVHDKLI
jgi:hypothetical protein